MTIVRVLDDGSARFDMTAFKKSIETELQQEAVLIIRRRLLPCKHAKEAANRSRKTRAHCLESG
jgi:hypothetical protein